MYKTKGQLNKTDFLDISEAKVAEKKPKAQLSKPVVMAPVESTQEENNTQDIEASIDQKKKRSPIILAVVAICLVFAGVATSIILGNFETGNISVSELTAKNVMVNINSQPQIISTNAQTVSELLKELGVTLSNNDYMDKKREEEIVDGMKIWLRLSVPVTLQVDGRAYQFDTQPITVEQALDKYNIAVGTKDILSQPLLSYIYEESTITVSRVDVQTITEDEFLPQGEQRVEYQYLAAGAEAVVSEGSPGVNRTTYEVVYSEGEEINRTMLSTEKVRDPIDRIIGYGPANSTGTATKAMATTDDGSTFYYVNSYTVEATAYTWTGNRTATGTWPKVGTIAVDPKTIPLGSKVYIEGYGFAVAEDTGGLIKNFIIDLYMDTEQACLSWGRRSTTLYILE